MKAVLDLTKAITDYGYFNEQFENSGKQKNILFVEPQLTSKHLYKYILPFFSFYNENIYTAITGLDKYNPYTQLVQLQTNLDQRQILWANFIVFPFTTMDLSKEYGIYEAIREINPSCKIVFFVDFNFYELPNEHPHKELFSYNHIIDSLERNILYSDLCLTTNLKLHEYLHKKLSDLINSKYEQIQIPVSLATLPYLIDNEIVLQNIDFESYKPEPVINRDLFKKIADKADEIKKEDLENNKEKAKKISNRKQSPKKEVIKTKKVIYKDKSKSIERENDKDVQKKENIEIEAKKLDKKYRIGIICSPTNYNIDIKPHNQIFRKINETYGDSVSLVFLGYDYDEDKDKDNILEGVNFEYIKQVSIIHYYKQLKSLELDLILVPIERNTYNVTSENTNKYLEASLFKIPIIADDVFPYNLLITNERNGFLYNGKESILPTLERILSNKDIIKVVSDQCYNDVLTNYGYTKANIDYVSQIYR